MAPNHVCPNCGGNEVEQNDQSGETVCTNCGVVLEESNIVSSIEFVETSAGTRSVRVPTFQRARYEAVIRAVS